jgi:hypothetical protein
MRYHVQRNPYGTWLQAPVAAAAAASTQCARVCSGTHSTATTSSLYTRLSFVLSHNDTKEILSRLCMCCCVQRNPCCYTFVSFLYCLTYSCAIMCNVSPTVLLQRPHYTLVSFELHSLCAIVCNATCVACDCALRLLRRRRRRRRMPARRA